MLRTRLFRITFSRLLLLLTGVIAVGTILGRSLGLGQGRALAVDAVIRDLFASLPGGILAQVMRTTTHLADELTIVVILLVLVVAAIWIQEPRLFWMPALAVAGASLLVGSIKLLVGRPRPESAQLAGVGGYSFPSGHTLHAVVLYFSIAIVLTVLGGDDRRAFALWAIIAGAIALAVGVSRVYLGAHFASDVLAAWFLGALWVYVFFASLRHHVSPER